MHFGTPAATLESYAGQASARQVERSARQPALAERHLRELHELSGIPLDVIAEQGYRTVTDPTELLRLGFEDYQARTPGILFPLLDVHGRNGRYAFKPDAPRVDKNGKPVKYEHQRDKPILDVPRRCLEQLVDASVPLVLTEGSKKAACLAGLGYCALDVWGVHNWYRQGGSRGFETIEPLVDWEDIPLDGRYVYLAFDSDAWSSSKPSVGLAMRRLANFLARRGAIVLVVRVPDGQDGTKQGVDDLVASCGREAFDELVVKAAPWLWGVADQVRATFRENRKLKDERRAIVAVLRNKRLSATERIVGLFTIFGWAAKSREKGQPRGPARRITVDAPADPEDPDNGERVGLAAEIGLSPSTVYRAHETLFGEEAAPGAPLAKDTVPIEDERGRQIGSYTTFTPSSSEQSVPGMLWRLARHDPQKPKQHGGAREPLICPEHPEAKIRVRHTAICTVCGQVVDEHTTTAPRPTCQLANPVAASQQPPTSHVQAPGSGARGRTAQPRPLVRAGP